MSLLNDINTGRRRVGKGANHVAQKDVDKRVDKRVESVESRLAELRHTRAIPARDLASRAGVSRQTIYAMEAGDYIPNTAVALKLARILETTVEDLFRLAPDEPAAPPTAHAALIGGGERFPGTPLELCRVDGRLVAVPSVPAPWRLPPADGLLIDPARSLVQLLREEDSANRLLIAGCDPATSVLARHLQRAHVSMVSAPVNSSVALGLLTRRLVHVAGTHLRTAAAVRTPAPRSPRNQTVVFVFATWEQGLVLARGNPKRLRTVDHLARRGVRLANREKGSGSRQLLDARLKVAGIPTQRVAGYDGAPADGHLAAAWRVYSNLADCCVATRSAARAFGLDFLPLASERYDLVIHREHLDLTAVARLLDTLTHAAFRRELESLCAYDTGETGKQLA